MKLSARTWRALVILAGLGLAAACSAPSPAAHPASPAAHPASTAAHPASTAAALPRPIIPPATPDAGPPQVTLSRVRTADGSVITVAVFGGRLRFALHNGSQDPGHAAAALVQAGPVVTGAERQQLLAAFNGGFKLRSRAGGYEQEGHLFRALRHGLASLVIDRSGRARIGVWGTSAPTPGEAVYSVRQNLWPLVLDGKPTAQAARWWRWGGTVGHATYVARSAVGQTAAGNLIYTASMSTVPADLASVLARSGARIAMELDINPYWVQLDTAGRPGGPLTADVPGQQRPADQFLTGWIRDFFTVLVPPA